VFIPRLCLECECVLAKSISINKQYIRYFHIGIESEKTSVFSGGVGYIFYDYNMLYNLLYVV